MSRSGPPMKQGLYDPAHEHDACGVGFVVDLKGRKTHSIVEKAIEVLLNLEHRGACGCEKNTGDGAGILLQTPHGFLAKVCCEAKIELPDYGCYAVGMVFLPVDGDSRRQCEEVFEAVVREEGQRVLGWRVVPTNNSRLGPAAKAAEPAIKQIFIGRGEGLSDDLAFERKLYVIRRKVEKSIRAS